MHLTLCWVHDISCASVLYMQPALLWCAREVSQGPPSAMREQTKRSKHIPSYASNFSSSSCRQSSRLRRPMSASTDRRASSSGSVSSVGSTCKCSQQQLSHRTPHSKLWGEAHDSPKHPVTHTTTVIVPRYSVVNLKRSVSMLEPQATLAGMRAQLQFHVMMPDKHASTSGKKNIEGSRV